MDESEDEARLESTKRKSEDIYSRLTKQGNLSISLFFFLSCDLITSGQLSIGLVSLYCKMCLCTSPVADCEQIPFPALREGNVYSIYVCKILKSPKSKESGEIVGYISLHCQSSKATVAVLTIV